MRDSAPDIAATDETAPEEATPTAPANPSPEQDAPDDATPDAAEKRHPLEQSGGEALLHIHDIARKLGLTVKQAWKQVHAGRIPVALRIKDRPRFRISDINRLVAERAATTTAAVAPDAIAERGDYEWCSE